MDYNYLQSWMERIAHDPPPLPPACVKRIREAVQTSERGDLNEHNIDAPEGVRCILCDKVLKYGTRRSVHKDKGYGYVCPSCRSDHEKWVLPPGEGGSGWNERLPKQTTCEAVLETTPEGRVKRVHLGCGAVSGDWEPRANGYIRLTIHTEDCAARRYNAKRS